MKAITVFSTLTLILLSGCASWERPYISGDDGCDEIVDARERLDCHDRADRAEDDWREQKRREEDEKKKTD